jgi:hypothetical protein
MDSFPFRLAFRGGKVFKNGDKIPLDVIPAEAGIQYFQWFYGFPFSRE